MSNLFKISRLTTLFCTSICLSGCVNLDAVGEFAVGAEALSEASAVFYDKSLDSDRYLAKLNVDLAAPTQNPLCRKADGSFVSPWDCASKGDNLIAEARRHRAATAALAQYAQSLEAIANFDDDAAVAQASQQLSDNLKQLAKTLDASVDAKESALAEAIGGLAKVYIDLKARDAIFHKTQLAQPAVASIVHTLQDDIKRQRQRLSAGRLSAQATREQWFEAFRQKYQAADASPADQAALSIAAGHLVDDELLDKLAEQPDLSFLDQLQQTAESCLQAHIAIQNPDLGDKIHTVHGFFNDARNLTSALKNLSR